MPVSSEYIDYVMEQLAPIGRIDKQRLFGGYGLSRDALQFALVSHNSLYFTVDDVTRPHYEQYGMPCFAYSTKHRHVSVRSYYEVPEEVLTDDELLREWVTQSLQVARRKTKSVKKRKVVKGTRRTQRK